MLGGVFQCGLLKSRRNGKKEKLAIGHDAVHVEKEQFDFFGAGFGGDFGHGGDSSITALGSWLLALGSWLLALGSRGGPPPSAVRRREAPPPEVHGRAIQRIGIRRPSFSKSPSEVTRTAWRSSASPAAMQST